MRPVISLVLIAAGCGGNVTLGGPPTLVRVDAEPAGLNCANGGVAIHTGVDKDGNGYLDDNEITSTQYVCNGLSPVQCDGGNILTGTVAITADSDLAQLADVNCVDGDLLISGLTAAELPDLPLAIVTGDIVFAGNQQLTSLAGVSGLREVGGSYVIQGNPMLADLVGIANLNVYDTISLVGNDSLTNLHGFEGITELQGNLIVADNANLTSLRGLDDLLASKDAIAIRSNPNLTSVDALYQLRSVGGLEISGNPVIGGVGLAALEHVVVRLIVQSNSGLTVLAAPVLKSAGDFIQIQANGALANVDFPELITSAALMFVSDPSLTTIHAPNLAFTTGEIELLNDPVIQNVDFGKLGSIGGSLIVQTSGLRSFAGFSHVTLIGGALTLNHADAMSDFTGLDAVTLVTGDMTVQTNATLTSFTGLGKLTEIGGALTVMGNPMLPSADATAFAARVDVHGVVTIHN